MQDQSRALAPALQPVWLGSPGETVLRQAIASQSEAALTYSHVGATRTGPPEGYGVDRRQIVLGEGPQVYERARDALRAWRMFDMPWVHLVADAPPHVGQVVAFSARVLGVWTVHVCRVVYASEEDLGSVRQATFAYGTLPWHGLRGEEGFVVSWNRETNEVTAGVHQFSVPGDPLTRALGPLTRAVQRRFVEGALASLKRSVAA